jgi:hypothetical protein
LFASEPFAVFPSGKNVRGAVYRCWQTKRKAASCRSEQEGVKSFFKPNEIDNNIPHCSDCPSLQHGIAASHI